MKHSTRLFLLLILLGMCTLGFAQVTGDFRSSATGNWNDYTKWQRYNGSSWVAATSGQTPNENTSVYVQSGHIITLTQAEKVKDLHISKGTSTSNATNGRVQLATFSLELYGKLRTYYAAVGTVPGTSTTTMANMLITRSDANGKLVVKGSSNRTLVTDTEWSDGSFTSPPSGQFLFNIEIAADDGVEINLGATLRAFSWNLVSGTLNVANASVIHADENNINVGNVTVGSNAVIIANASSSLNSFVRRKAGFRGGTFTLNGLLKVIGTDTAIAMSTVNLNGTVEYARAGAQNFIKNGGDGAVIPSPCNNVILSGSGTKTLATDVTINGTFTIAGTAGFALSTFALTYGASSTLEYAGTSSQNTTNAEFPATNGPRNVVINNSNGVTLNSGKTIVGDLTLLSGNLAMGANALNVQGTTFVDGGAYTGGSGYTDGYDNVSGKYMNIAANDVNMSAFSASTAIGSHYPAKTDREWNISATFTGNKTLTLYWTSSDDHNYNWVGLMKVPSVYIGGTEYTQISYDVSSDPRWVTVSLSSFDAKGFFLVGPANDVPLPAVLSSFTATLTAENFVTIKWVTQSETGVGGYYIYRSMDSNWVNSERISDMINSTNSPIQHIYQYTDNALVEDGTYYYWLQIQDLDGRTVNHGPTSVQYSIGNTPNTPELLPPAGIISIYPNPITPYSVINYNITKAVDVSFNVYNSRGQMIRSFNEGQKNPGSFHIGWDGRDSSGKECPNGIYFIKMQAGRDTSIRKTIIMK